LFFFILLKTTEDDSKVLESWIMLVDDIWFVFVYLMMVSKL
jgi:hypothetical protein